ncbi:RHS repeat-associated core domain-containing protein [Sorangium sp. So ce291]|uniref:RHS repeat-associated core domain-containing protein n=1 Tax=Sorangium sp. So ce291 TaxID=3133294 RepID=UPI003F6406F4
MSTQGNPVKGAAAAAGDQAEAPKPLISPTGNASLDVLAGDINDAHAAFQPLSDPEATTLDKANAVVGGTLNAMTLPITLLNDGFALATRDIGKLIELPAATLGMLHLGIPHVHLHPPAMPIPLPSFGPVVLAGCASVLINGIPAARAGDMGISLLCGTFAPPFEVFTGSSKVFFGGARAARMLDITMHCMPGAGAAKAMATLMKVASVGMGVVGVGAGALDAVTKAQRAKRLRAKKVEPKAIDPAEAAKMTPEELAAAQEAAAAEAAEEQQENLEEAAADEASAKITGIQAGLDAAALALSLLMGLDPGTPPCIGAVLTGHPNVLVGGFPMPPWSAVARGLGKLGRRRGAKPRGAKPKKPGPVKGEPPKHGENFKCDGRGEPVDPVTGANVDHWIDFEEHGAIPFRWGRSYNSADAEREGPMGRGFRHSYERSLTVDLDQANYTDAEGRPTELPLPSQGQEATIHRGYVLRVQEERSEVIYTVSRPGEPTMEFVRERRAYAQPRLTRFVAKDAHVDFIYDENGRLSGMLETSASGAIETRLRLDDRGHILEVRRGSRGERNLPLIAAYGYDRAGCLVAWQDALGASASYAYDSAGRMVRKTDRNGYSFHYTYDDLGRCVEEHGSDGRFRITLRYDREARRTFVTEVDGGEWIIDYDTDGTITRIQDPYGGARRRILTDDGRVVREVGPGPHELIFLYDATGNHHGLIDRFGCLHPTLDEQPNPESPLSLRVPATARAQQWGAALDAPAEEREAGAPRPARQRDTLGRIVGEVDHAGRLRTWAHDSAGNVVRYVDRDGREHRSLVTSWNLVSATVDPLGHHTLYDYTMRSKVARIVDAGGSESRYEYDLKDRLVRVVRHGVLHEEYSYDSGDCLIEKRDGAGNVLLRRTIGYDGLPTERWLASGEVYRYAYDVRGQVTRASTRDSEVQRAFDKRGRLLRDERDGRGVTHRFEGEEICETTYFGRFTVTYQRSLDGALLIEAPVGGVQRIRRGAGGSVLTELGNGTTALSSYDEEGRCQGRELRRARDGKTAVWSVRYTYTGEGDLIRAEDDARGVTEYAYDAAHRLVAETRPDGATAPIVLDAAGNVLEKPGLARVELLEGNRLRAAGREQFRYNARNHVEEHQTGDGERLRYRYDSVDMLVEVSSGGREEAWGAGYDGLRRRTYKAIGKARTEFTWDEHRLAAEVGPTGALRIYVYAGPDALVPLMFIDYDSADADPRSGRAYYPIGNQIGVPLHIEDQAGSCVWRAEHVDPYGAITLLPGASVAYALRFPGHYHDEETGLHYNRFRYFSPRLGRYLQSDPIGQEGGVNLYAYAANPLLHVDVLGLAPPGGHRDHSSTVDPMGDAQKPKNPSDVKKMDYPDAGKEAQNIREKLGLSGDPPETHEIPKNIHRFWTGGPLSEDAMKRLVIDGKSASDNRWDLYLWHSKTVEEQLSKKLSKEAIAERELQREVLAAKGYKIRAIEDIPEGGRPFTKAQVEAAASRAAEGVLKEGDWDQVKHFSDLARLIYVREHGGFHMDVDIGLGDMDLSKTYYHNDPDGKVPLTGTLARDSADPINEYINKLREGRERGQISEDEYNESLREVVDRAEVAALMYNALIASRPRTGNLDEAIRRFLVQFEDDGDVPTGMDVQKHLVGVGDEKLSVPPYLTRLDHVTDESDAGAGRKKLDQTPSRPAAEDSAPSSSSSRGGNIWGRIFGK